MPFLLILSLFLLMLLLEFDIEAATRVMGRHCRFRMHDIACHRNNLMNRGQLNGLPKRGLLLADFFKGTIIHAKDDHEGGGQ